MAVEKYDFKKATQEVHVMLELFNTLTVVVDTQNYIGDKLYRT